MSFINPNSKRDLLFHMFVIMSMAILLVLFVFQTLLPRITRHGESIAVPDVTGLPMHEFPNVIERRNLRYEVVEDSAYNPKYPPLTVLNQVPLPNVRVKENRKIYVSLNAKFPPLISMPTLKDLSIKAAIRILNSYGFISGKITYVPDPIAFGTVHKVMVNNIELKSGEKIAKGSIIDLIVGDGLGNVSLFSPFLIGLDQEEAEIVIIGSGLKIGNIKYIGYERMIKERDFFENQLYNFSSKNHQGYDSTLMIIIEKKVVKQYPEAGTPLEINDIIDFWVYMSDSLKISSNTLQSND